MRTVYGLLLGLLLIFALPSASAAAAMRSPTERWIVNFADNQCIAIRQYGSVADPLTLILKPSPIGDVMQLSVIRKSRFANARERKVVLETDGGASIETNLLAYNFEDSVGKGKLRVLRIALPKPSFAPISSAKSLSIRANPEIDEEFALSAMPGVMRQLDACLLDLQKHWNIAANEQARLRSRAKGSLLRYVNWNDYPEISIRNGDDGTVGFALLIDEKGKVADCMITQTSNVPILDAQTCSVFAERAQFEPAVDMDGKPAKDSVSSRMAWVISR